MMFFQAKQTIEMHPNAVTKAKTNSLKNNKKNMQIEL